MESLEHNWANISEKICLEVLVIGKKASWMLFFKNILTNPIISQIYFLWRHTLELYSFQRSFGEHNLEMEFLIKTKSRGWRREKKTEGARSRRRTLDVIYAEKVSIALSPSIADFQCHELSLEDSADSK